MKEAGLKCGCDKVVHHQYEKYYGFALDFIADKKGSMIEVGIDRYLSLSLWKDVLPNLFVYGIDISQQSEGEGYKVFRADQSKDTQLDEVIEDIKHRPVWLIIDDGSHVPEHQLSTFNKLFPLLEEGGVYIIEDVEVSYWKRGGLYSYATNYGYKHPKSIIEVFKENVDCVNMEFCGADYKAEEHKVKHGDQIKSVTFSRNCIIIIKGTADPRPYRFADRV